MRILKRKPTRLVRLHLVDDQPSIEGVWLKTASGHYVLAAAQLLVTTDQTIPMAGEIWVPEGRVLHVQVLG